jgi:hypothetical protein
MAFNVGRRIGVKSVTSRGMDQQGFSWERIKMKLK